MTGGAPFCRSLLPLPSYRRRLILHEEGSCIRSLVLLDVLFIGLFPLPARTSSRDRADELFLKKQFSNAPTILQSNNVGAEVATQQIYEQN